MLYIKSFFMQSVEDEYEILCKKRNIHNTEYPLGLFPAKQLKKLEFAPITVLYGENGSGKTTLIQMIAEKVKASRKNIHNPGELFNKAVECCEVEMRNEPYLQKKLILSDDVFDFLLDQRAINSKVNRRKQQLSEEYQHFKYTAAYEASPLQEIESLRKSIDAKHMTESRYIRTRLGNNLLLTQSNGESALDFWQREIEENAVYLIDEPENSLSAESQLKLKQFIEESARFYGCQFIIATHSPFLLSLKDARIYDLDSVPLQIRKWTELKNIQTYYHFFIEHKHLFEKNSEK